MRPDNEVVARVGHAVTEIKNFYDRCDQRSEHRFRLTASMLAYALGLQQTADVYPILNMLEQSGYSVTYDEAGVTLSGNLLSDAA